MAEPEGPAHSDQELCWWDDEDDSPARGVPNGGRRGILLGHGKRQPGGQEPNNGSTDRVLSSEKLRL